MIPVINKIEKCRIIPVISLEEEGMIEPICKALKEGGLEIAEITFRTKAAEKAIRIAAKKLPGFLLGAGTVTSVEQLEAATSAGVQFAVAPGLNPKVVRKANEINLPFFPGVATPSEVEEALDLGCRILKFFPAEAIGGIDMLKAIYTPYSHLGVRFIPTGGIEANNMMEYLSFKGVIAVGGSWLAPSNIVAERNWQKITDIVKETVAKIS